MEIEDFNVWIEVQKVKYKDKDISVGSSIYKTSYLIDLFKDFFEDCWNTSSASKNNLIKSLEDENFYLKNRINSLDQK